MSKLVNDEKELNECLKANPRLAVLFYASWCYFSQAFLPIFEKRATGLDELYRRVVIDDLDGLVSRDRIEVYPTVIYFERGKESRRLDGVPGRGLDEDQLNDFIADCRLFRL